MVRNKLQKTLTTTKVIGYVLDTEDGVMKSAETILPMAVKSSEAAESYVRKNIDHSFVVTGCETVTKVYTMDLNTFIENATEVKTVD